MKYVTYKLTNLPTDLNTGPLTGVGVIDGEIGSNMTTDKFLVTFFLGNKITPLSKSSIDC